MLHCRLYLALIPWQSDFMMVCAACRAAGTAPLPQVFQDLDFTLLEMNPFTLDAAGAPFPLDMRGELDDTAAFKSGKKWGALEFPLPFGRTMTSAEEHIHSMDEATGENPGRLPGLALGRALRAAGTQGTHPPRSGGPTRPSYILMIWRLSPHSIDNPLQLQASGCAAFPVQQLGAPGSCATWSVPPQFRGLRPLCREVSQRAVPSMVCACAGASLKLSILNPAGHVWIMVAGGGASVIYADTVGDLGFAEELGNYAEYSGAPNAAETYAYAKTLLDW